MRKIQDYPAIIKKKLIWVLMYDKQSFQTVMAQNCIDEKKKSDFRNVGSNIFRSDDTGSQTFDLNHERNINNFPNLEYFQIELHEKTDLVHLNP